MKPSAQFDYPSPKYNIVKLSPKFESIKDCILYDRRRIKIVKEAMKSTRNPIKKLHLYIIKKRLNKIYCTKNLNLASRVSMRIFRIRIIGEIARLINENPSIEVMGFTLTSSKWVFSRREMSPDTIEKVVKQLRNRVRRLGVKSFGSYVIAFIDISIDKDLRKYYVHFHGIISGEYIKNFDSKIRSQEQVEISLGIIRPLNICNIYDKMGWISYMFKSLYYSRAVRSPISHGHGVKRKFFAEDKYIIDILSCLSGVRLHNAMLVVGLKRKGGIFHINRS